MSSEEPHRVVLESSEFDAMWTSIRSGPGEAHFDAQIFNTALTGLGYELTLEEQQQCLEALSVVDADSLD